MRDDIATFVLNHVTQHPSDITRVVAKRFGISRQAAHRHVANLVDQGALLVRGRTRGRHYALGVQLDWSRAFPMGASFQEDVVWRNDIAPVLAPLPDHVREIWAHGFTHLLNNAAAHAGGRRVTVSITNRGRSTRALVIDDGVGIFRKLQRAFGLLDERHARLELAKGRLTTDPAGHQGQGLGLVSRLFDDCQIVSGGLTLSNRPTSEVEWLTEFDDFQAGTAVVLHLATDSPRSAREVPASSVTTVPVRLAVYGDEPLISRSQARRLMARLEDVPHVELDFAEVPAVGEAFADEIFRVFRAQHPDVQITAVNLPEPRS